MISHWVALLQTAAFAAFLIALVCAPKGKWRTRTRLSKLATAWHEIDVLRDDEQKKELKLLVAGLEQLPCGDFGAFGYFKEKLFKSIDYAIRRHDWYEDQRSKVFQQTLTISLAILTIALTVAGLVIKEKMSVEGIFWCLLVFILIAIVSLVYATVQYNGELNRDRPYRLISDIRFWYFRYNLPDPSSQAESSEAPVKRAQAVAYERSKFFKRLVANLPIERSIREDFEQLFILQVLQRYKMESLERLQWLLVYLSIFTAVEVLLTFLLLAMDRL
jgi:hypothetical protein